MNKILIVDDEIKLRNELKYFLENNGYEVNYLEKFDNCLCDIKNSNCDLILLDINLPNLNGEFLCKELRKELEIPIIMVTSRNTDIDEIISISSGADDFIAKPYNPQVLLARIDRLLKRSKDNANLQYNNLTLDIKKSIIVKDNQVINLSKNELKVFYYLLLNRGHIISRDDLMDYLWNNNDFIDDNTLTVNINRLRAKLNDLGYDNIIITKRGQGYIII